VNEDPAVDATDRRYEGIAPLSLMKWQRSKIWGFHGGDYEECCRLGYKKPVRTSQETYLRYRVQPINAM
jgi:hypothetical protein